MVEPLTFISTARPLPLNDSLRMDGRVSRIAPAASSMSSDHGTTSSSASSVSVSELCRQLDRHSLQPSRRNVTDGYLPFRACNYHTPVRPNRMPSSFNSSHAELQRHSMIRRQANSTHLTNIHRLVEGLLSDAQPASGSSGSSTLADTTSPLSLQDTLPPIQPSYMLNSAPTSSTSSASEADESDSSRGIVRRYMQHKLSRETMRKQNVVLKSIRVRRTFAKRKSQEASKWNDR